MVAYALKYIEQYLNSINSVIDFVLNRKCHIKYLMSINIFLLSIFFYL